jgi:SAM-dependent methyltransferase
MAAPPESDLYARAGIRDVADFYRTKFVSDAVLDHHYFKPLDRFDLRFARTMWVYDNVRRDSSLLDLGCGVGMLALLKRKNVTLTGVDISDQCVAAARRNGYDATVCADLVALPFPDDSFDYVASLDVIGHIAFEQKDKMLAEIKRVLRPDGVTLHGIESTDRATLPGYDEMSAEELSRFISVDGHVGLEEDEEIAARFRRFFAHVAHQPRYALCLSAAEFLKEADGYGRPFEVDFLDYLRGLSFRERRSFDIAMGYVFNKVSDLGLQLPRPGLYTFLKASDAPLGPFYNEHRDRRDLLHLQPREDDNTESVCLDRYPHAIFDDGWYEPDNLPPIARWMSARGCVRFRTAKLSAIRLDLTTHLPDLHAHPLGVQLNLNGGHLCAFTLFRQDWLELTIQLPVPLRGLEDQMFELTILADRTWRPCSNGENRDDRELSIAVCNLHIS